MTHDAGVGDIHALCEMMIIYTRCLGKAYTSFRNDVNSIKDEIGGKFPRCSCSPKLVLPLRGRD